MIGEIICFLVGVGAILLGLKGFSDEGLPLTKTRKLRGTGAKIIGILTIGFGVLLVLFIIALRMVTSFVANGMLPPVEDWF